MLINILLVVVGLVVLLGAGEMLVKGAVGLAKRLNVPTLLIGLTIVAFGTSAPELMVSVQAVLTGDNGIAVGNIVGSNIANILFVLGFPSLLAAISLKSPGLRRHAFVMLAATFVFAYLVYVPKVLTPTAGAALMAMITAYICYVGYSAMRPGTPEGADLIEEVAEIVGEQTSLAKTLLFVVIGLIGLPIGGGLLVTYGAKLAAALGVRDEIIGLTIVAFGTSLPEFATTWAAAVKRHADVAVGNIVGSNIFNILFVGGAVGLTGLATRNSEGELVPTPFSDAARAVDVPMMIGTALILAILIFARGTITRAIGAVFAIAYIAYVVTISTGAL